MRLNGLVALLAFLLGWLIGHFSTAETEQDSRTPVSGQSSKASSAMLTGIDGPDAPPSDRVADSLVAGLSERQAADPAMNIALEPNLEPRRIRLLLSQWPALHDTLDRLERRVTELERRLLASADGANPAADAVEPAANALPFETPEDRRAALVVAGVSPTTAQEIVWRQSQAELERLELRDRAIREGWLRSDRYFEQLQALHGEAPDLRTEIGEQAYDRYLYNTGESNRIRVTSVIQGSAAELSGLLPGDIIERYSDDPVYSYTDLRNATTSGARDESVPVLIRRGEEILEVNMPRGPLGVRLEGQSVAPNG